MSPKRPQGSHTKRGPVPISCPSAIVAGETDPDVPRLREEVEKMARRRHQKPKPFKEGAFWWMLCWQDEFVNGTRIRKRKRVKLAPVKMPFREVQKVADEFLNPLNLGLITHGSATNFSDYVNNTYLTHNLPLLSSTTQERYGYVIRKHLLPAFGKMCLRDLTPMAVQNFCTHLPPELSYESKDKIRDVLSSILVSAKRYGLLVSNPVEGVRLPPSRRGNRIKPYVTPQQFNALVELIPEPYASMVYVAVYTGLRVSELIALRWQDVGYNTITIDERYCRGDWGCPKSSASNATIAVNKGVISRIHRLKTLTIELRSGGNGAMRTVQVVRSSGPEDLVFQSLLQGKPMRDNNILTRHLKPAGRKLGIPFVNWRCLRTSHATWLKLAGADIKDAQAQMRHSRASTTLNIYQQFVPESQRLVVEKLSALCESGAVN
jgi:integrase